MKIQGAALVNRFYVRDGWTKEAVAGLIAVPKSPDKKLQSVELRHGIRGEPLYYAVYDDNVIFDKNKVQQHKYSPFSMMRGKVDDWDKLFSSKNQWK